jgi:hypothetical protein
MGGWGGVEGALITSVFSAFLILAELLNITDSTFFFNEKQKL